MDLWAKLPSALQRNFRKHCERRTTKIVMDPKTANLVREWKAGYKQVNRLDIEEARARTPAERLRNHQVFLGELSKVGLLRPRTDDLEYHLRWQQLREKWLARNS
jgi:hypothetical protein